jgi:hypothetical protein
MKTKLAPAFGLAVVLLTPVAWGQNRERVRVTWAPRPNALPSSIEGHV